jgi:precorrin-2 dehydrogenase/sirohydrochlorin ferrochelatase
MIPLFVDCTGKQVVIFGGGDVAARKASRFFLEAEVIIISRSFSKKCSALPVRFQELDVRAATDDAISTIIRDAFLVVAALSDKDVNNRIGELCRKEQILFNNADGKGGDVVIPAVAEGQWYTLAISTHGNSPAISRFIRQEIEKRYPALDAMIELQNRLREHLKSSNIPQKERSDILWQVLNDQHVWDILHISPEDAWRETERRYLHD